MSAVKEDSQVLSKDEAIAAMVRGEKVAHRYFSDGEWVTMTRAPHGLVMLFEDGVKCNPFDFWKMRDAIAWETDWRIIKEPKP